MAIGINGAKNFTSYFIEITSEFWNELKGTLTEKSASLKSAGHPERTGRWQQEFLQSLRGILSFISASPALSFAYECFHFHCSARPCSQCPCFNKELNVRTVHKPVLLTLSCLFVYYFTVIHFLYRKIRNTFSFFGKVKFQKHIACIFFLHWCSHAFPFSAKFFKKYIFLKTNHWRNRWFNKKFQGALYASACHTEYKKILSKRNKIPGIYVNAWRYVELGIPFRVIKN
jgi:hypothetical protein